MEGLEMLIRLLILLGLSSPAFAAGPDMTSVLGAVFLDGLIAAVSAIAVLAIGVVMANYGSKALVSFVSRMSGTEQVLVKNEGFWDKDVYQEAMESLAEFKRKGGRLDRESQAEYDKWLLTKVLDRREVVKGYGIHGREAVDAYHEEKREKPWKYFDRIAKEDKEAEKAAESHRIPTKRDWDHVQKEWDGD